MPQQGMTQQQGMMPPFCGTPSCHCNPCGQLPTNIDDSIAAPDSSSETTSLPVAEKSKKRKGQGRASGAARHSFQECAQISLFVQSERPTTLPNWSALATLLNERMKLHAPDTDPKRAGASIQKQWLRICENAFTIPKADKVSKEAKLTFSKSASELDSDISLSGHLSFQPNRAAAPSVAAAATPTTSAAAGPAQVPTTSTAAGAAQAPTSTTKKTGRVSISNGTNEAPRHKRASSAAGAATAGGGSRLSLQKTFRRLFSGNTSRMTTMWREVQENKLPSQSTKSKTSPQKLATSRAQSEEWKKC